MNVDKALGISMKQARSEPAPNIKIGTTIEFGVLLLACQTSKQA